MENIVRYMHHGVDVAVREDLKGKHREFCLCYTCKHFQPQDRAANCPIANLVYAVCNVARVTLPVWECACYEDDSSDQCQ